MQGSSSRRAVLRRSRALVPLVAGILAGGVALMSVLVAGRVVVRAAGPDWSYASWVLVAIALAAAGDLWAIRANRLYPLTLRRQAKQTIMFRWTKAWRIGFMWGLDAGFSVGTYRVTSGLWVGALVIVLGLASPLLAVVYVGAFALALAVIVIWPVAGGDAGTKTYAARDRIHHIGNRRRLPQSLYVLGLLALVVGRATGWIGG